MFRKHSNWLNYTLRFLALFLLVFLIWLALYKQPDGSGFFDRAIGPRRESPSTGLIVSASEPTAFSLDQTNGLIRQTQGAGAAPAKYAVTKRLIAYTSQDTAERRLTIGGRIYLPSGATGNLPVLAFAPGTTGIGDQCAASKEEPAKANWANYDSHLAAYAAQGFAVVTTDYEGLGDLHRLHHYMVGEMEGRSLLDAVRALYNLPAARGLAAKDKVFLAGYSQGGHAAFWADRLNEDYAPELQVKGVIGFGPVMDVTKTWRDITVGANINWFGPLVIMSYQDYYRHDYPEGEILLPERAASLESNVTAHCIDSLTNFWGRKPDALYTPGFLQALRNNNLAAAGLNELADDMAENQIGDQPTPSAKLINQGALDNVVLPGQQTEALRRLCTRPKGAVGLVNYPRANHYNTMSQSFSDTLGWINNVIAGQPVRNDCRPR